MRQAFLEELFLAGEAQRADVCTMPRGKKGGEGRVVSETGHWAPPWTCVAAHGRGGCRTAMLIVGDSFVGSTEHQSRELKLEHEENAYVQTCGCSHLWASRNNQVKLFIGLETLH